MQCEVSKQSESQAGGKEITISLILIVWTLPALKPQSDRFSVILWSSRSFSRLKFKRLAQTLIFLFFCFLWSGYDSSQKERMQRGYVNKSKFRWLSHSSMNLCHQHLERSLLGDWSAQMGDTEALEVGSPERTQAVVVYHNDTLRNNSAGADEKGFIDLDRQQPGCGHWLWLTIRWPRKWQQRLLSTWSPGHSQVHCWVAEGKLRAALKLVCTDLQWQKTEVLNDAVG